MYDFNNIIKIFFYLKNWGHLILDYKFRLNLFYLANCIKKAPVVASRLLIFITGLLVLPFKGLKFTLLKVIGFINSALSIVVKILFLPRRLFKIPKITVASIKKLHQNSFHSVREARRSVNRPLSIIIQTASVLLLVSIILNNFSISLLGVDKIANYVLEFIISGRIAGSDYVLKLVHFYIALGLGAIYVLMSWATKNQDPGQFANLDSINYNHQKNKQTQINLVIKESSPINLIIRTA